MPKERGALRVADAIVGPIRFRAVGDRWALTTDWGAATMLSSDDFDAFIVGELEPASDLHVRLDKDGFTRTSKAASFELAAPRLDRRRSSVGWGPHSHLIHVTRAPRDGEAPDAGDMSLETAERCLELVFRSTSPRLRIAISGPAALRNHAAIQQVVTQANKWNEDVKKQLAFELWSDLEGLAEPMSERWLAEQRVSVYALLTPAALKDEKSPARAQLRKIADAFTAVGENERPTLGLVVPCDRAMLGAAAAIVGAARACGCDEVYLQPPGPAPLSPPGADAPTVAEWLKLFEATLDAVLKGADEGRPIMRGARLGVQRILGEEDPFDIDLRSPATDGNGQLCYASDGTVCASDFGRVMYERGDDTFRLGVAGETSYREIVGHPTVRGLAVATMLEGQPGCIDCAYMPFCGQSPTFNYCEQGSIQGRMADSAWCARVMGTWDLLFDRLYGDDESATATLQRWGASAAPSAEPEPAADAAASES